MGSKNTPAGNTTTTTNTQPWSAQQPYLAGIFNSAQNLWNAGGPQYYPGATYAGPTEAENQGLNNATAWGNIAANDLNMPALNFTASLLNGGANANNPANVGLSNLGNLNIGQNNYGTGALSRLQGGQTALSASDPYTALMRFAGGANPAGNNPAYGSLTGIAGGNIPNLGAASGALGSLATGTPSQVGQAGSALSNYLGNNFGATGIGANQNTLEKMSTRGFGTGIGENQNTLENMSTQGFGTGIGKAQNELSGFAGQNAANAPGNTGSSILGSFANKTMSSDPLQNALAQSVMSSTLPGIESQFIQGGGLSSPDAMYAASQGTANALAPIEYQQWQQEQANKLAAGQSLASNYLAGTGLQQGAAQAAGQLGATRAGLKEQAAQAAGQLGTAKAGLQEQAAGTAGQLGSSLGSLLSNTALGLGNLGLGAGGLQQSAASALGNLGLGAAGAQTQAGSTLGSQLLQGAGLQQQSLQNALSGALGLGGLQEGAASTLGNQGIQGNQNQLQALLGLGQQYLQGTGQQVQGLGLLPNTVAGLEAGPQAETQAGQTEQQNAQQQINDLVQRWNYGQTLPYQALNQLVGQVTGNYGGSTTLTQPFYQNAGANIGSGILGGLGAANMIGGSNGIFPGAIASLFGLISDRRLKTDIMRVGQLDNGLPVYAFRYRCAPDGPMQIGVMADEVEQIHPEAVHAVSGYKMVDYAQAVR